MLICKYHGQGWKESGETVDLYVDMEKKMGMGMGRNVGIWEGDEYILVHLVNLRRFKTRQVGGTLDHHAL